MSGLPAYRKANSCKTIAKRIPDCASEASYVVAKKQRALVRWCLGQRVQHGCSGDGGQCEQEEDQSLALEAYSKVAA